VGSDEQEAPAWFTEARQGSWKVGDQVVVTLGECQVGGHHGMEEYGVRGFIVEIGAERSAPDHPYVVYFYRPLDGSRGSGQGRQSWTYAGGELRRFDPKVE
jgi:hypothetical protein